VLMVTTKANRSSLTSSRVRKKEAWQLRDKA
jgi:hypothetical protein